MSNPFFEHPILNSPYSEPVRHWELDEGGQPTQRIIETRRSAQFITPIPAANRQGRQTELPFEQKDHFAIINGVRAEVGKWRQLPPSQWRVTPETARLLQHWRSHPFASIRPFFCQIEAVETAIWLTEVAPSIGNNGKRFIDYLKNASAEANPGLPRLALKLATGAGKTTVMAMLIAWQTINAVRHPRSELFTRGFLIAAPGITIRDRLRVLLPNDPDSYYANRELIPSDMLADIQRAHIVITNYHTFQRRELLDISKGARALLQGPSGAPLDTVESEGQMLQRAMPELLQLPRVMVINDEAHHCYREKTGAGEETLTGDDEKKEASANNAAARLWISGIEALGRAVKLSRVIDLSATPFFLRGSGYAEGTLFPWVMSDFSLMDAIECGIVKLPRVPVSENIPGSGGEKITTAENALVFRHLWEHIKKDMPKKGRGKSGQLNPQLLPPKLKTALQALYGHYQKTFEAWQGAGREIPPCFIVVCNNTAASKLVADYIAGYWHENPDGTRSFQQGALPLFCNYSSEDGEPLARPHTILIDSQQLESGAVLDPSFKTIAAAEIERFRREIAARGGESDAQNISDQDLLREVMNTVGKPGRLGAGVRCVVSVSMLTEGWDANTVTHVLGVRAFGTQLLCEQVTGRALRRLSYTLDEEGLLPAEYADILGIPFSFTASPVPLPPPPPPPPSTHIHALPERSALEIRFPRVLGWRAEAPGNAQRLEAQFTDDSRLEFTPALIGPTQAENAGIVGEKANLTLEHLTGSARRSDLPLALTDKLLHTSTWQSEGGQFNPQLFSQLKRIVRQWLDGGYLICKGGTAPELLPHYPNVATIACQKITAAILRHAASSAEESGAPHIRAILDPYNPGGSTAHTNFRTAKTDLWKTARSHLNYAVLDSGWEAEFCRILDQHPRVLAWVKNQGLGFEIPYLFEGEAHRYTPDFIVRLDDGHGANDPLHLIVEVKGYRGENAKAKKETVETHWLPAINRLQAYGRWTFAELRDVWEMQADMEAAVQRAVEGMIDAAARGAPPLLEAPQ